MAYAAEFRPSPAEAIAELERIGREHGEEVEKEAIEDGGSGEENPEVEAREEVVGREQEELMERRARERREMLGRTAAEVEIRGES